MSKPSKQKSLGITSGTASILMIFVVLCITTFATLSFVQANAQVNLARRNMTKLNEYYAADVQGLAVATKVDEMLDQGELDLAELKRLNETCALNDDELSYTVDLNERQYLSIVLDVSQSWSKVISWQLLSNDEGLYEIDGFVD